MLLHCHLGDLAIPPPDPAPSRSSAPRSPSGPPLSVALLATLPATRHLLAGPRYPLTATALVGAEGALIAGLVPPGDASAP